MTVFLMLKTFPALLPALIFALILVLIIRFTLRNGFLFVRKLAAVLSDSEASGIVAGPDLQADGQGGSANRRDIKINL